MKKIVTAILLLLAFCEIDAQKPRARDIEIPFDGTPGTFNAITDVKAVELDVTLILLNRLLYSPIITIFSEYKH